MSPVAPLLVETVKHVTVVTINESSVLDARMVEAIRADLAELIERRDRRHVILDLSEVRHLSSAALGMLIPLHQALAARNGRLVLCGLRKDISKLLKVTGLHKMFNICKEEKKALLEFGVTY